MGTWALEKSSSSVLSVSSLERYEKLLIENCKMKKSSLKERRRTTSLNNMIQDMEMEALKEKISNKHKRMVKEIDDKLDRIFDDFLNEITKLSLNRFEVEKLFDDGTNGKPPAIKSESTTNTKSDEKVAPKNNQKLKPRLKLPEKVFQPRNSLLTDLFEIKHIRTIYHTFIVIFNLLLLNVFVSDFADTGRINIGLGPIVTGFGGFHYGIFVWSMMQVTVFTLYPAFILWAKITRNFFATKGFLTSVWHFFGVLLVIAYHASFVYVFTKTILHFDMALASSVAVLMECVRFIMKSYAFVRTNVPRVLNSKNKLKIDELGWDSPDLSPEEDNKHSNGTSRVNEKRFLPSFGQYCYFLFAPTLVYRDEYPRTKQIRWRFIAKNLIEVIAVIFIYSLISERLMYPVYNQFGINEVGLKDLVASVFNCMLPGLLCFLCGFYCVLHSWQNAFAELLRFADRKFYSDWWNSTNFSVYYRTWNIIVHDWLYLYVYKDLYEIVTRRNMIISQLLVFSISAIVHEYILGFTFKFFYPILFCQFQGAGVMLVFITKKKQSSFGNIFMWLSLAMGMGMLFGLYHMEVYARKNCDFDDSFKNLFIPVSWTCNGIKYSESWEMKLQY